MDLERTMEFVVDNLAKVTAAQQQAEVRAARADRRIHGLQTLMKFGMKRLARLESKRILWRHLKKLANGSSVRPAKATRYC